MPFKSDSWRQSLNSLCSRMNIEASDRTRLCAALYYLSNEHHYAIVELVMRNITGSAFSLLRPQLEAYIRGLWSENCATEKEVKKFLAGAAPTQIKYYLDAIESLDEFKDKHISKLKVSVWEYFCDFTHGGGIHASWHIGETNIGSSYSHKQIKMLHYYSDSIALSNTLAFARLCGDENVSKLVCASHRRIFGESV